MTFERLRIADWVAFVAALALLFVMALDWYSTPMGREARRIEQQNQPHGALGGEIAREVQSEARLAADKAERNAWQADGGIDRVILVALLLTAGLGVAAAFFRAAGRRFEPPWTPSALAALGAVISALLVAYRIIQEPGPDAVTTVQAGAPLAVAVLGALALASATGMRAEEAGRAFREPRRRPEPAAPAAPAAGTDEGAPAG
jgi:hypothetical protein